MGTREMRGGPAAGTDARSARRGAERADPSLRVSVDESGPWTVVTIAGEMDLRVVPVVRALVRADARDLAFVLREVTFMDACGLDLLLRSRRAALRAGGRVRVVAPSAQVLRVFALTGAGRGLTTFDSVEEALAAPTAGVPPSRAPAPRRP